MPGRLNVYIPDDLKRRMDKVKTVNWSKVACAAFEVKLGELATEKKEKKMTDVIQRLRASSIESGNEERKAGAQAGRAWASENAEAAELKLLAKCMGRSPGDDVFINTDENAAYSGAERFVFTIQPDFDRQDAAEFWAGTGENENGPTDEFVQGFAEGAVAVWNEVKDQI